MAARSWWWPPRGASLLPCWRRCQRPDFPVTGRPTGVRSLPPPDGNLQLVTTEGDSTTFIGDGLDGYIYQRCLVVRRLSYSSDDGL